jgi:RNA polymerase sigma-70 factor, ECF subfamily
MTLAQERELLQRIQLDPKEFGDVFDFYYKPIFGYLYRRTGDYDLARDMAAETFLKAFLKIHSFTWRGISISSWLYKIATNEANQFSRRQKYKPVTLESILDYELLRQPDSETERTELENEMRAHQDFISVQQAIKRMSLKYQEVIALRYFESKDIREIGEILGKPKGTIKSLLSRGMEKLRRRLVHEK